VAEGIDYHIEYQHQFFPELALSLLCHGPIERGVDASHGSLDVTLIGVDGSALATTADSLAAIEQRVEKEAAVTWNELYAAMKSNWLRAGKVRRLMRSVPGYGRGGTRGDWWAQRVSRHFSEIVVARPTPAGWRMAPGIFTWSSVLLMGRQTGATPDGRAAGDPISFGANPNPERTRGGSLTPTAMSTAVADIQPGYGNTAPLHFDVDPGLSTDTDGIDKFDAFLRMHFELGGTLVNANVLDRHRVLDACRHPDKHPDLVIRVTGFSAYFASLSDEFRKLVYERIVAMEGD
jgi:formate C-acetyltransferase